MKNPLINESVEGYTYNKLSNIKMSVLVGDVLTLAVFLGFIWYVLPLVAEMMDVVAG